MKITETTPQAPTKAAREEVTREQLSTYDILMRSGFIGMADSGRSDGSTNYKSLIAESLARKIGKHADR